MNNIKTNMINQMEKETDKNKKKVFRKPQDQIDFVQRHYKNNVQDNLINQIYDCVDVMINGKKSFQNDPDKYIGKRMREIQFENILDHHSCKVYSSFAWDSSKGYLNNNQIFYDIILNLTLLINSF